MPLSTADYPSLPQANYVFVSIANTTGLNPDQIYVSIATQTQAYGYNLYQSGGNSVFVAAPRIDSGSSVPSIQLSDLYDSINGTFGFYVAVFAGSAISIEGCRIYFADQANAVPYSPAGTGSIPPNADFNFDFIEFSVGVDPTTNHLQFNVDTSQVDQVGMPIFLQVDPVVPDFADGTGIVQSLTRAEIITQFQAYTATGSNFTAYQGVASSTVTGGIARLLAPQHVIDAPAGTSVVALEQSFDAALYSLFNYYYAGTGGGGNTLYLVGNGASGFEIFAGTVITTFAAKDHDGNAGTYTVFQFVGTGYQYNGQDATLTRVGAWGGATYQVFYPYFGDSPPNSISNGLSSGSNAPFWFGGFGTSKQGFNLPITSAGRMVLGASGVFADNASQDEYYGVFPPKNFDPTMLGNLENQLCTMLNRGVTPVAVGATTLDNLRLRTGSNLSTDLIYVDLSNLTAGTTPEIAGDSSVGATTLYDPSQLITSGNSVYWNTLQGQIYFEGSPIQTFKLTDLNDITQGFTITPASAPANWVTGVSFTFATGGQVTGIIFDWSSAVGVPASTTVSFSFSYGPTTTEAHYATLRLFTPYGQPTFSYRPGDLGPASGFSTNLVGCTQSSDPTSGMTVTGIAFDNPTYVYQASSTNPDAIIIYSPQALPDGLGTNIITFCRFYPVDSNDNPYGQWNAYAAFFHIGDPANGVAAPTVDGKGYAFAYDDNGGYSSDITAPLPNAQNQPWVVLTLSLTLLAWT